MWLAGGGVKGGTAHRRDRRIGLHERADPYHIHDLHATILHLMGMDHMALTYLYNGRFQRLTENGGTVITGAFA